MVTSLAPDPAFVVTLESESGWSAPVIVRLRRALKALHRGYGLRVVQLNEVVAESHGDDEGTIRNSAPPTAPSADVITVQNGTAKKRGVVALHNLPKKAPSPTTREDGKMLDSRRLSQSQKAETITGPALNVRHWRRPPDPPPHRRAIGDWGETLSRGDLVLVRAALRRDWHPQQACPPADGGRKPRQARPGQRIYPAGPLCGQHAPRNDRAGSASRSWAALAALTRLRRAEQANSGSPTFSKPTPWNL